MYLPALIQVAAFVLVVGLLMDIRRKLNKVLRLPEGAESVNTVALSAATKSAGRERDKLGETVRKNQV